MGTLCETGVSRRHKAEKGGSRVSNYEHFELVSGCTLVRLIGSRTHDPKRVPLSDIFEESSFPSFSWHSKPLLFPAVCLTQGV